MGRQSVNWVDYALGGGIIYKQADTHYEQPPAGTPRVQWGDMDHSQREPMISDAQAAQQPSGPTRTQSGQGSAPDYEGQIRGPSAIDGISEIIGRVSGFIFGAILIIMGIVFLMRQSGVDTSEIGETILKKTGVEK